MRSSFGFAVGEIRLNAEGDVLLLDQSVVALGELALQHTGILEADVVEGVLLCRDVDALKARSSLRLLKAGTVDIEVVPENRTSSQRWQFCPRSAKAVVDVLKGDGLRVEAAAYLADAVAFILPIRNGLLG